MQNSADIRKKFLEYFQKEGHNIVSSSPVVPFDDPTLLFTNAGMNQFKDLFLGKASRDYKRAATSQKCIRAGGKHNDLENVGHTSRHLTFFEMLGNFSFGDYFKKDAIRFAWEVSTKVIGFDPDRIWPTVFREDDEAFELWKQYVPASRITRMGEEHNFWEMGEVGPCGPSSELHYDRGESFGKGKNPAEDTAGERFLEFWNLVFMQYNRNPDRSMTPLPKPSIDTGAGLERMMALVQGKESVYETDILRALISQVEEHAKIAYDLHDGKRAPAFRVIADHLRSLSFAIADGAEPSNVERGYVLRKILRRAVRYGRMLGFDAPFLADLVPTLCAEMGAAYPELKIAQKRIQEILTREEEQFFKTLKRGGALLSQVLERSKASGVISGDDAFKLKDTYGLPLDEVQLLAVDSDYKVDIERYRVLEQEAKERSKASSKTTHQAVENSLFEEIVQKFGATKFIRTSDAPYTSTVLGIFRNGTKVLSVQEGEEAEVVLAETPFYAEMGGQIGDTGVLENSRGGDFATFEVQNCIAPYKGIIVHRGIVKRGTLSMHDTIMASVDRIRRRKIECNHTATHLLHYALHQVLGEHARQAGSVVDSERLRFDFSHHKSLEPDEILAIEKLVNQKIRQNIPVEAYELSYEEAKRKEDIKQFFGEKYGSVVRVVAAGDSKELCGGTHTSQTGNIGYFRIVKEASIAAGTRRIEAVTGEEAEEFAYSADRLLGTMGAKLQSPTVKVADALEKLFVEKEALEHKLKAIESSKMQDLCSKLVPKASKQGISVVRHILESADFDIKDLSEAVARKFPSSVVLLGSVEGEKAKVLVRVPKEMPSLDASQLLKTGLPAISGKGGGRKEMAQGAGDNVSGLASALDMIMTNL